LAEDNSRLFLWTVTRYVEHTYSVARAWGFTPAWLVTWCKPPGFGGGWEFTSNCEYLLVARRGKPELLDRAPSSWFDWPRPYANGGPVHAAKPDAFYDLVEKMSPGPYLELFARRQRLGWDTWGNEALEHVEMASGI
jgi:N6-adenosine-specific RNA methylase IME4